MLRRVVHPGEVLKGELEEFGITPTEFAAQSRVSDHVVAVLMCTPTRLTSNLQGWLG